MRARTWLAEERSALARAMLVDEAFALHFMEDVFAAGHVAGTWGDVSQRKGTHDYYNESGLEVRTWQAGANTTVLMGDAHMRPEDAERAAAAVRLSLEQVLDTAAGRSRKTNLPYTPAAPAEPEAFDVCTNDKLAPWSEGRETDARGRAAGRGGLLLTPVPSLGARTWGRCRASEQSSAPSSAWLAHSTYAIWTAVSQAWKMAMASLAGRTCRCDFGYGLDGVLGEEGDGLVYFSVGYSGDTPSSNKFSEAAAAQEVGTLTAAIPGRTGYSARLRMPFYLIPGDLLLLSPLYFASPTDL